MFHSFQGQESRALHKDSCYVAPTLFPTISPLIFGFLSFLETSPIGWPIRQGLVLCLLGVEAHLEAFEKYIGTHLRLKSSLEDM